MSYIKTVKRPKVVEELYQGFSTIDVHDHYRQGCLEIERQWKTQKWPLRIFGTMLGMIVTNAYFAYSYTMKNMMASDDNFVELSFNMFLGILAKELITNDFLPNSMALRDPIGSNIIIDVIFINIH